MRRGGDIHYPRSRSDSWFLIGLRRTLQTRVNRCQCNGGTPRPRACFLATRDVGSGSKAPLWPCAGHFRSSSINGRFRRSVTCLKRRRLTRPTPPAWRDGVDGEVDGTRDVGQATCAGRHHPCGGAGLPGRQPGLHAGGLADCARCAGHRSRPRPRCFRQHFPRLFLERPVRRPQLQQHRQRQFWLEILTSPWVLTAADDELSGVAFCRQGRLPERRLQEVLSTSQEQAEPVAVEILDRQFAHRLFASLFERDRGQRAIGLVLAGRAHRKDVAVPVRQRVWRA